MSKLRNAMIAMAAVASIGIAAPQAASAHGFGHGGGFHGGGFGGFHGGGWGGFHHGYGFGPGFAVGTVLGLGLYAPYYYGYPDYDYPYAGYDEGYYGGDCMIVHHRVHTRHGWRYRIVHVCE